jgi:hypothetical protein
LMLLEVLVTEVQMIQSVLVIGSSYC